MRAGGHPPTRIPDRKEHAHIQTAQVIHQPFELGWMDQDELVGADAEIVCECVAHKFHAAQGKSRVESLHRVAGEINKQAARDRDDARLGQPLIDQQQMDGIRATAEGFFRLRAQEQPDLHVLIQLQPGCGRWNGGGSGAAGRREGRPDIRSGGGAGLHGCGGSGGCPGAEHLVI